ncbi:MAG: right-handed parallel beta-helix repeat-containing protein, partial [Planctomycetales bacterium]|nr:right-handed parallel beta-helix repeat-containing protein [Planctomycetales bacterium]
LRNVSLQNCRYMGLCNYAGKMSAENLVVTGGLYGVYWYRPKGLDVVKCRFEGSRPSENGWAAHGYGAPATNDLTAVRIRNSVFNNYHNGIYTYLYGDEGYQPNYEVYNNTFAKLQYWGAYADRGSKPVIRNNIFARAPKTVGGNGLGQNLGAGALLTHSHNLLSGFATSFYNGVIDAEHTTVVNEVRFVDETSGDFHLAKGSPAINAGTDLRLEVPTDMDGNPRPAYKAFEIGAYEYTEPEGSLRILSWTEEK